MSQGRHAKIAFDINLSAMHFPVNPVTLHTLSSRWHHCLFFLLLDRNETDSQRAHNVSHSISMFVCASDMMPFLNTRCWVDLLFFSSDMSDLSMAFYLDRYYEAVSMISSSRKAVKICLTSKWKAFISLL